MDVSIRPPSKFSLMSKASKTKTPLAQEKNKEFFIFLSFCFPRETR